MDKNKTEKDSSLEKKIKQNTKKMSQAALTEHNDIVEFIRKRCKEYGYNIAQTNRNYIFNKSIPKPGYVDTNQGEIDLYAINHHDKRIVIFEVKTGNKYYSAKKQLYRANAFLKPHLENSDIKYQEYRVCLVYVSAGLKKEVLKFNMVGRIWFDTARNQKKCEHKNKINPVEQKKHEQGKERKQRKTVKNFRNIKKLRL